MNKKQFRNSHHEVPTENGVYEWKSPFGHIPVEWIDGEWYTKSGDKLNGVVCFWR